MITEEQFRQSNVFRETLTAFLASPTGVALMDVLTTFAEPSATLVAEAGSIEGAYHCSSGRLHARKKIQSLTKELGASKDRASVQDKINALMPERPITFTEQPTE